jgi:hypothetical protein
MDLFISSIDPLYGLSCLRTTLHLPSSPSSGGGDHHHHHRERTDDDYNNKSKALGLRSIGTLFGRLPAEVLEEEIPKLKDLFQSVSWSSHTHTRTTLNFAAPLFSGTEGPPSRSETSGRRSARRGTERLAGRDAAVWDDWRTEQEPASSPDVLLFQGE